MVDEVIYLVGNVQVNTIDQDEEGTSYNNDVTSFSFDRHKTFAKNFQNPEKKELPTSFAPL
jgi:hypothetical protein